MATLGENIKNLRINKGVTQEALAASLGVTYQAVSKWENNSAMPDIQLLPQLSVYFGVTIDELFDLSESARLERIEHMLEDKRTLSAEDFQNTEQYLLKRTFREPEEAHNWYLLGSLHNHRAASDHAQAEVYLKKALALNPRVKDYHAALVEACHGALADWDCTNHHVLIDYYKDFVTRNPDYWPGYLWLCDQLIPDGRLTEAREYVHRLEEVHPGYLCPVYEGKILAAAGRKEEACAMWDQMVKDHSDNWLAWFCRSDELARMERYEEAIAGYQKAMELQPAPAMTDGWISIAHLYEIMGRPDDAIVYYKKTEELLRRDWHITSGEGVDWIEREIERCRG